LTVIKPLKPYYTRLLTILKILNETALPLIKGGKMLIFGLTPPFNKEGWGG